MGQQPSSFDHWYEPSSHDEFRSERHHSLARSHKENGDSRAFRQGEERRRLNPMWIGLEIFTSIAGRPVLTFQLNKHQTAIVLSVT